MQSDDELAGADVGPRKITCLHIFTQYSPHELDEESVVGEVAPTVPDPKDALLV